MTDDMKPTNGLEPTDGPPDEPKDWGALSRAARDAAYNNPAACPGGPA